ncbi:YjjW family glycine radical enzyme activase [Vibrio aestuarianus]|uniref:YjjW family glycine radical enzyme activase n=1 Tax=Vibrio aestuarianus TaxID=28171 RepID=A0AAX3U7R3_9VIBR|nr:YjjW family glycine radical enzyme activase [Vibrio aestuarianus]WGK83451.1 YjjW family glycine radical enzyme activase [Vibrio aestuarianus]
MMKKVQKLTAKVSRVLTFSCVDGPGNRLVIFLQGCNFTCLSCHNPHTINHCNHCGNCVSVCPSGALTINSHQQVEWQEQQCIHCDRCIEICSHQSNPKIHHYRVAQLLDLVRKYRFFLSGITVSGGEATLQLPIITALFKAIKQDKELCHLSCFIDSNGSLSRQGWEKVTPYLDGVMIDLKAWQNETHQWLVGRDNHRVMKSISYLSQVGKLYEVRLLFIPNKSDLDSEIDALADYLRSLPSQVQIRINAFQHHGVVGEALTWQSCDEQAIRSFHDELFALVQRPILLPSVYCSTTEQT